ncbi:hypothetical protein I4U23_016703 [Adineta vaga]|nr:hypothetical protein I4U23_016703 [Adineta vaga]
MLIGVYFRSFLLFLKKNLFELNLFNNGIQDEIIIQNQRRSTRLYLFLLISSMLSIALYNIITVRVQTMVIKSPSFNEYSFMEKQTSFQCFCTKIAIKYEEFIQVKPTYHELCESHLISDEYINQLYSLYEDIDENSTSIDFHRIAVFQFITLRNLCQLTKETIENHLKTFLQTDFIHSQLFSQQSLQIQMTSLLIDFIDFIPKTFLKTLKFIQNITAQSLLMTGASVTSVLPVEQWNKHIEDIIPYEGINYTFSDGLSCTCSSSTSTTCIDLTTFENETIPGFQTGCYMLSALFKSTLEVFYNQTFVDLLTQTSNQFPKLNSSFSNKTIEQLLSQMFVVQWINETYFEKYFSQCAPDSCQYTIIEQIQQFINSSTNLTLLKSNIITSTTIEILANNLFIQSWKNESLFESYFNQCYPLTCQYSIQIRLNFIYIITKILGLIGGINIVLRLFLPFIVTLFFKFLNIILQSKRIRSVSRRQQFYNHCRSTFNSTKKHLIELNLFPTIPLSQDPIILERNRCTTRIYLILLITTLIILTLYGLLRQETNTIIIESPSISTYHQLLSQYSLTLECLCSNTAIKYNKFITQIEPQYHEICSSIFISSSWQESIDSLYIFSYGFTGLIDYRNPLRLQFQALGQLCRLSQNTVNTSLTKFGQNNFITSHIISPSEFHFRTETIFEQFKFSISQQFMETFKLIQLTNYGNQLGTVFSSNWEFRIRNSPDNYQMLVNNPGQTISALTMSQIYNDCSCGIQTNCSALSYRIAFAYPSPANVEMPGFHTGCLFFDSLLQSTLACLYNRSCLSFMQTYLYHSKPIKANILKYSSLSPPDTKIETLLNQLFVSQWFQNTSFDHYFDECRPQSCQYSYLIQYNTIYVITMLIALFGGLTNGLHIFVYYTELIFIKLITCRKNINSITPHSQNLRINTIEQISDPIVTTSIKSFKQRKYRNRTLIICLILLAIGSFITTSIILFRNQKKEENIVSTTKPTIVTTSIADMNFDGFIDLILILPSNILSNEDIINVFLNSGDGYQFDLGLLDPFWIEGNISAIVIHDSIDNEVYQISLCSDTGSVQLKSFYGYNNTLYYSFSDALTLNGYPTMMIKGTFNDDTIDDFAIISPETDTFHVIISLAWLRDQQIYLIESYPTAIARINFNNDSFDDVAILTCNGTLTVYVPQGNEILDNNDLFFKINTNNNNNNSQCFHSLHVVDLNQDTRDDLVFIDAEMNQIRVALGLPCDE